MRAVAVLGALALLAAACGGTTTKSRTLCDNSLCLTLPDGWSGRTEYGGTASRLIVASFPLPRWVGVQGRKGVPHVPHGQVEVLVLNSGLPYRYRHATVASVRPTDVKALAPPGPPALAQRSLSVLGRSLTVTVFFAERHPANTEIADANRVLATLRRGPSPLSTP